MPPSYPAVTTASKTIVTPSAKILQDQLHDLITRLTLAGDHIKTWVVESGSSNNTNDSGGSAVVSSAANAHNTTIHAESTARFIALIHEVMKSLQKVEATLKTNTELRQVLQSIHVPYDLLELLDYTSINPDLYLRGLVNEATQQLVGLQRRKNALHLLSTTIENRLNYDDEQKKKRPPPSVQQPTTEAPASGGIDKNSNNKRGLESTMASDSNNVNSTSTVHSNDNGILDDQPATKKPRM